MNSELEFLKELDSKSKNLNLELDKKNEKFIKFINKRKAKEQEELLVIKEKIQDKSMKKIYLQNNSKIDTRLDDLYVGNIEVADGVKNLRKINKSIGRELEIYNDSLSEFINDFNEQCSKNKNLKADIESLVNLIEDLF